MPPFLNTLRRILPLRSEEDDLRTPDFNPQSGKRPMPMARPLPAMQSEQPQIPQPRPVPMLPVGGQFPTQMPAQPDPDRQEYGNFRPMQQAQQQSRAPIQLSDARPSTGLTRPTMRAMPDIPQLPGQPGAPRPYNSIDAAELDYVMKGAKRNPDGTLAGDKIQFKRSGKDIALGALRGLQQGGLFGAAAGALTNVIAPMEGRQANFQAMHLPRLQAQQAQQQQEEQRQQQQAMQALAIQRGQVWLEQELAQTDLYKIQAELAKQKILNPAIPQRPVRLSPMVTADGSTILVDLNDPENAGKEFKPFQRPDRPPSMSETLKESEAERAASEGEVEQIAEDSYQGRGGDQYVFSKLRAQIREILTTGTIGGSPATPGEIADAQDALRGAIAQERKSILEYTKGQARGRTSKRAVGKRPGAASATGTRSLRDLESKYFGGR